MRPIDRLIQISFETAKLFEDMAKTVQPFFDQKVQSCVALHAMKQRYTKLVKLRDELQEMYDSCEQPPAVLESIRVLDNFMLPLVNNFEQRFAQFDLIVPPYGQMVVL